MEDSNNWKMKIGQLQILKIRLICFSTIVMYILKNIRIMNLVHNAN